MHDEYDFEGVRNNPQSFINSESHRIGFIGLPFATGPHPINLSHASDLDVPEFSERPSGELPRLPSPSRTNFKEDDGLTFNFIVMV